MSYLSQIANHYYKNHRDNLSSMIFVFPNRRAGLFFKKALADVADKPFFAPRITPINDLISSLSELSLADNITSLVTLYQSFCEITKSKETLDKFLYWGDMMLADFSDLDKYLVDAEQLLRNIHDLGQLSTLEYLSEEQKEIIEKFWKITIGDKKLQTTFYSTYNNLLPIYNHFRESLKSKGFAYQGMLFREVAERLINGDENKLDEATRIVFVGFNALNKTESALFDYAYKRGVGDYYFDYLSPLITPKSSAGMFIAENKKYKSIYPILAEPIDTYPTFEIYSTSSQVGQTKIVSKKVKELYNDLVASGVDKPFVDDKTAIVMPDESLLSPLLKSLDLPKQCGVNITMGYPLGLTPLASLMQNIVELQNTIRVKKGEPTFYHKPVNSLLHHQYIYESQKDKIDELISSIRKNNQFFISQSDLNDQLPVLNFIFRHNDTSSECGEYICELIDFIAQTIIEEQNPLDIEYLDTYRSAVLQLMKFTDVISPNLFYRLLHQLTAGVTVPFEGEPLGGLQVMGILESRAIDFDTIIIPSFNDEKIPQKHSSNTLIPYSLRKGFGLPTYESLDAIHAYNFYRLIYRAKRIIAVYDTRVNEHGEISRFYNQLRYLHSYIKIEQKNVVYQIEQKKSANIQIDKGEDILAKLDLYLQDGAAKMSASSINNYINCSLRFYYEKILKIVEEDELNDEIDGALFGNIYHKSMERIYQGFIGRCLNYNDIEEIKKNDILIEQSLGESFRECYFKNQAAEIEGYNKLIYLVIKQYIFNTLDCDIERARISPITYIASERSFNFNVSISNNRKVHFVGIIDRIDSSAGVVNIIDYKTGKKDWRKEMKAESMDSLFDQNDDKRKSIMLQTLLYTAHYKHIDPQAILVPSVYPVFDVKKNRHEQKLLVNKNEVTSQSVDVLEDFNNRLIACLEQLFDPASPFCSTTNSYNCTYCPFKLQCGR